MLLTNKKNGDIICLSTRNRGDDMTDKQKEVLERVCKAIEPLNDDQLEAFLKIGDGMIIMQNILLGNKKDKHNEEAV